MNDKVKKDLVILIALIVVCAICARYFAKGETLEEYAKAGSADSSVMEVAGMEDSNSVPETIDELKMSDQKDMVENDSSVTSADKDTENNSDLTEQAAEKTSNAVTDTNVNEANDISQNSPPSSDEFDISENFYYEPLSDDVISRITGISYVDNPNISLDDLRYISLLYVDFNGDTKHGEMICNKSIAKDLLEIFYELYNNDYQLESVKLIDEFDGDDTKSMLANNTSCFNYRVVEGSKKLSNHAYGLAVDINPFYNPYITYKDGVTKISPAGSEAYADRTLDFPYKIDENDLAYKLFTQHGFKWGGNWNSVKDYQHFERSN